MSQAVARLLGVSAGEMVSVPVAEGCWLFHFWGDVYGLLLADLSATSPSTKPVKVRTCR
ncbi:MAG: hypothetical protein R2856_13940 [Caldilineaceae bacterium]